MDDRELRRRIDAILDRYDHQLLQHWARRIVLSSAAAGFALGLAACPPELQPPGPDARSIAQPVPPYAVPGPEPIDPGIYNEYGVEPDLRPAPPDSLPVAMYAADVRPEPPGLPGRLDPGVVAEYAAPIPQPVLPPVQLNPGVRPHEPRPAYAVPPPEPRPVSKYAVQMEPDALYPPASQPADLEPAPVARYAVRVPRPRPDDLEAGTLGPRTPRGD